MGFTFFRKMTLQRFGQICLSYGLGYVVIHSCIEASSSVALHGVRCHSDDGAVNAGVLAPANLVRGFKAIHFRHLTIHEDCVVREKTDHLDCLPAIGGDIHAAAQLFEQPSGNQLIDGVVFNDQNTRAENRMGGLVRENPRAARRQRMTSDEGTDGPRLWLSHTVIRAFRSWDSRAGLVR